MKASSADQRRTTGRWLDLDHPDQRTDQRGDHRGDHESAPPPACDLTARTAGTDRVGLVDEFMTRLVAHLGEHAPPGRLARPRAAEAVLARACLVLTDGETAYRTGQLLARTADLHTDPASTLDTLLAAVAPPRDPPPQHSLGLTAARPRRSRVAWSWPRWA